MNDKSLDIKDKGISKKKNPKKKILIIFITIFVLVGIALLCGHFLGEKTGLKLSITDVFNPIKANPQLKKDSSGVYTNTLIVGIDTRSSNPGLQNTDSIMLLSYNHEEHNAILISIPRDFFVEVPEQGRYTKINGIYAIGERMEQGNGLKLLQTVVEEITNQEIQYYGMANLSGFVDLIDTLGGVEVDVENAFVDHQYPLEGAEHRFQTISFDEGLQKMDGKTALRFVRSRTSITRGEGSDFARARRQQRLIVGLKDTILSSETLLNPKKVFNIISLIEQNLEYSDFSNEEAQAVIKIFQKDDMKTYSFVLDPSLANYKLITDKGLTLDAYTIGPKVGLSNYEEIHKFIEYAYKKPLLYSENPTIYIYDVGIGNTQALEKTQEFQEELPYINIQYMGTILNDITGDYLYKTEDEQNELDNEISENFSITMTEKPEFVSNQITNGDYIILLGSND